MYIRTTLGPGQLINGKNLSLLVNSLAHTVFTMK